MGYEKIGFFPTAFHHECAKTTTIHKPLLALLAFVVAVLLSACGVNANATGNSSADLSDLSQGDVVQDQPSIETSTAVELQIDVTANSQYLMDKGNGVYNVELPDKGVDYPAMPTYTWYINGTESDKVTDIVLEFDLIDTVVPLDNNFFGYDRGYFVTLHNFETIPLTPSWWRGSANDLAKYGNTNRTAMILMPELGVDLQKYVTTEVHPDGTTHVIIFIPYSQFQTASKDLTLQFLPGTTFGNLVAYIKGSGLTQDIADSIAQTIKYDSFDHEAFKMEILRNVNAKQSKVESKYMIQDKDLNVTALGNMVERTVLNQGLFVNPDGSVNMHVSFYDIKEYEDEIQGEYAVVPEGLVSAFSVLNQVNGAVRYSYEDKRAVVEFALRMIDENGQFAGIYDISQGKIVALDRKASALPILSAMLLMNNSETVLTNAEIDSVMNLIIANNIVRVGDSLYYTPEGLSEDGVMNLTLDDFVLNGAFLNLMNEYSLNPSRLIEEFGCAKLMEAFANSLQLVLEGQEMNETRLPSSKLKVCFSSDGSYELQPSDTFMMEGSYFSMGLASYQGMNAYLINFRYEQNNNRAFDTWINKVSSDKDGNYDEKQSHYIREAAAMYSEVYNAYKIINTFYESWLDVYNFIKTQPVSTIYAQGYNVHTGEMIPAEAGKFHSRFTWLTALRERFGNPSVSMNWFLLVGMFNDEARMTDTASLCMNQYDLYVSRLFGSMNLDYSNPDIYADNGFNLWGYDSLKYILSYGGVTATECTRYLFGTSGHSLNRENTGELIRRTLNQFLDDTHQLGPDDATPLFYDSIPSADIVGTSGN